MLILVHSNKGESASFLSSSFLSTNSDSISTYRIFVKKFYYKYYVLFTYYYDYVLLDIQTPHRCLLQEAHRIMCLRLP